jgi:polyferredoxin
VQIRYGYFGFFLVAMPALGISACSLCNFITIPRLMRIHKLPHRSSLPTNCGKNARGPNRLALARIIIRYRYFCTLGTALISSITFIAIPRFYSYSIFKITWEDFFVHVNTAAIGVMAFSLILLTTLFFGRMWCGYLCPVGGLAELSSRMLNDRWKIVIISQDLPDLR